MMALFAAVLALTGSRNVFPFASHLVSSPKRNSAGSQSSFPSQAQNDRLPRPSRRLLVKTEIDLDPQIQAIPNPHPPVEGLLTFRQVPSQAMSCRGLESTGVPRASAPDVRETPQSDLSPPLRVQG